MPDTSNDLLTTAEAAQYLGMTPGGFRTQVSRSPALRDARQPIDGRTHLYPRAALDQWRAGQPGRGTRTDLKNRD